MHPSPKYYQVYQIQGVDKMVHIACTVETINCSELGGNTCREQTAEQPCIDGRLVLKRFLNSIQSGLLWLRTAAVSTLCQPNLCIVRTVYTITDFSMQREAL